MLRSCEQMYGYLCGLRYGVVLVRLDLTKLALEVLVEAVNKQPTHWGGWQELAKLVTDKEMVCVLLPVQCRGGFHLNIVLCASRYYLILFLLSMSVGESEIYAIFSR